MSKKVPKWPELFQTLAEITGSYLPCPMCHVHGPTDPTHQQGIDKLDWGQHICFSCNTGTHGKCSEDFNLNPDYCKCLCRFNPHVFQELEWEYEDLL